MTRCLTISCDALSRCRVVVPLCKRRSKIDNYLVGRCIHNGCCVVTIEGLICFRVMSSETARQYAARQHAVWNGIASDMTIRC